MNYTIAFLILIIAYFHTPISSLKAKMIFVSNEGSDTVTIIDSNKLEIIKTINTGGRPRDMRISPDKRFLYVATSEANHIEIIDLQSLSIIGTVETGDDPEIFAIDPENKIIVVSNEDDNEVTVIDINTKKIIRVVENVGIEPEGVTFSPDEKAPLTLEILWLEPTPAETFAVAPEVAPFINPLCTLTLVLKVIVPPVFFKSLELEPLGARNISSDAAPSEVLPDSIILTSVPPGTSPLKGITSYELSLNAAEKVKRD